MRWSPTLPTNTTIVTEFLDKGQNVTFPHFSLFSWQRLPYMIKPSSVTKRNLMVGMVTCMGIFYTPHQWCWYSDRKSLYWEKGPKVPKSAKRALILLNSAKLVILIFNPLHHTWGFFAPPRGQNDLSEQNNLQMKINWWCSFQECFERMGSRLQESPYEPQTTYHPHLPGWQQ